VTQIQATVKEGDLASHPFEFKIYGKAVNGYVIYIDSDEGSFQSPLIDGTCLTLEYILSNFSDYVVPTAQNEYYLEDIFDEDSKHEKLAETVPPGQYFLRHDPKRSSNSSFSGFDSFLSRLYRVQPGIDGNASLDVTIVDHQNKKITHYPEGTDVATILKGSGSAVAGLYKQNCELGQTEKLTRGYYEIKEETTMVHGLKIVNTAKTKILENQRAGKPGLEWVERDPLDDPYKNRPESYYGTPEEEAATYPQLKLLQGEAFVAHLPQDGKNAKLHLFFRIRTIQLDKKLKTTESIEVRINERRCVISGESLSGETTICSYGHADEVVEALYQKWREQNESGEALCPEKSDWKGDHNVSQTQKRVYKYRVTDNTDAENYTDGGVFLPKCYVDKAALETCRAFMVQQERNTKA